MEGKTGYNRPSVVKHRNQGYLIAIKETDTHAFYVTSKLSP